MTDMQAVNQGLEVEVGTSIFIPLEMIDLPPGLKPSGQMQGTVMDSGVLMPVIVRPLGNDRFELVDGIRRFMAARQAGQDTIEAVPRSMDRQEKAVATIVTNYQRSPNPGAEALAIRELMELGLEDKAIAKACHISGGQVSKRKHLLDLIHPKCQKDKAQPPCSGTKAICERCCFLYAMTGKMPGKAAWIASHWPYKLQEQLATKAANTGRVTIKEVEAMQREMQQQALDLEGMEVPEVEGRVHSTGAALEKGMAFLKLAGDLSTAASFFSGPDAALLKQAADLLAKAQQAAAQDAKAAESTQEMFTDEDQGEDDEDPELAEAREAMEAAHAALVNGPDGSQPEAPAPEATVVKTCENCNGPKDGRQSCRWDDCVDPTTGECPLWTAGKGTVVAAHPDFPDETTQVTRKVKVQRAGDAVQMKLKGKPGPSVRAKAKRLAELKATGYGKLDLEGRAEYSKLEQELAPYLEGLARHRQDILPGSQGCPRGHSRLLGQP